MVGPEERLVCTPSSVPQGGAGGRVPPYFAELKRGFPSGVNHAQS
jgi:hypothetical protein